MTSMTSMEASFQNTIDVGKINGAVVCTPDASGYFVYNKAFGERTLLIYKVALPRCYSSTTYSLLLS